MVLGDPILKHIRVFWGHIVITSSFPALYFRVSRLRTMLAYMLRLFWSGSVLFTLLLDHILQRHKSHRTSDKREYLMIIGRPANVG